MSQSNQSKNFFYTYSFQMKDGEEKTFHLELSPHDLNLINKKRSSYPKWADLVHEKCPHCPLDPQKTKHCPVAVNLIDVVEFFSHHISHDQVLTTITTQGRQYQKQGPLQKGLSSLMGICMVANDCPVMSKMKPMVANHLPFATSSETLYRALSMYLLAQYLLYRKDKKPDWDMKNLGKIYEDVRLVNRSFVKRLADVIKEDANNNAIVILDCFASNATFRLDNDELKEIEVLFSSYLKD